MPLCSVCGDSVKNPISVKTGDKKRKLCPTCYGVLYPRSTSVKEGC